MKNAVVYTLIIALLLAGLFMPDMAANMLDSRLEGRSYTADADVSLTLLSDVEFLDRIEMMMGDGEVIELDGKNYKAEKYDQHYKTATEFRDMMGCPMIEPSGVTPLLVTSGESEEKSAVFWVFRWETTEDGGVMWIDDISGKVVAYFGAKTLPLEDCYEILVKYCRENYPVDRVASNVLVKQNGKNNATQSEEYLIVLTSQNRAASMSVFDDVDWLIMCPSSMK